MLYSYSRPEDAAIPLVFTANRVGPSDLTADAWGEATSLDLTSMLTGKNRAVYAYCETYFGY